MSVSGHTAALVGKELQPGKPGLVSLASPIRAAAYFGQKTGKGRPGRCLLYFVGHSLHQPGLWYRNHRRAVAHLTENPYTNGPKLM